MRLINVGTDNTKMPKPRYLLIIIIAVVISLFFVYPRVKIYFDPERSERISDLKTQPTTLPKTWAEVEALQDKFRIDGDSMDIITVNWLRKSSGDFFQLCSYIERDQTKLEKNMGWDPNNIVANQIEKNRTAARVLAQDYARAVKTQPPEFFEANPSLHKSLPLYCAGPL